MRDNSADRRVTSEEERAADLAALSEAYTSSTVDAEPRWRSSAVHVNRYRTLYAAATVVLAVLLLRNPVPLPVDELAEETTELPRADTAATDIGVFPEVAADAATAPLEPTGAAETSPFEPANTDTSFEAPRVPPAPAVLRIAASGYASTFGGTPLEQPPPGDGLPIEALADSTTKYSFVRLSGKGRVLRLRMLNDDDASINDTVANVQACHITTANWAPGRGMATADAPQYDTSNCIQGTRATDGTWSFSFVLDDPADRNGWALVPVLTNDGTFRITFAPNAV